MFHPVFLIYPKLPTFDALFSHLAQVTHVLPCLPSFTPSYPRFTLFTLIYHVRSTKRPERIIYISLLDRPTCHHLPEVYFWKISLHCVFSGDLSALCEAMLDAMNETCWAISILIQSLQYFAVSYAPINSKLQHPPPRGIPRAFDCASCPGKGEFECCV